MFLNFLKFLNEAIPLIIMLIVFFLLFINENKKVKRLIKTNDMFEHKELIIQFGTLGIDKEFLFLTDLLVNIWNDCDQEIQHDDHVEYLVSEPNHINCTNKHISVEGMIIWAWIAFIIEIS